jgi:WhiB family redox-sensing transcriptional regulator
MTWRDHAACLDENPELFFPIGNADPAFHQIEQAKVVCRRCEVVQTCLSWAIDSRQDAGVWGGLSEDERHALKRRNARGPEVIANRFVFGDSTRAVDRGRRPRSDLMIWSTLIFRRAERGAERRACDGHNW